MSISLPEESEVERIARTCLKEIFPLFDVHHTLSARVQEQEAGREICIGYRTSETGTRDTTHFDIYILGNTGFLLTIEIAPEYKGEGYGNQLYKTVEEICRQLGCSKIKMTASGKTFRNEKRVEYLKRKRDYTITGDITCEKPL